jgi:hypothetical protein
MAYYTFIKEDIKSRLNLREAAEQGSLKVAAEACMWCQVFWDVMVRH